MGDNFFSSLSAMFPGSQVNAADAFRYFIRSLTPSVFQMSVGPESQTFLPSFACSAAEIKHGGNVFRLVVSMTTVNRPADPAFAVLEEAGLRKQPGFHRTDGQHREASWEKLDVSWCQNGVNVCKFTFYTDLDKSLFRFRPNTN